MLARGSGILLHPSSLPGAHGSGDLGPEAERFVDWLVHAGQTYWQVLPLGPVGWGHSPYSGLSASGGEPTLVHLGDLRDHGWLTDAELVPPAPDLPSRKIDFARVDAFRNAALDRAAERFFASGSVEDRADYDAFCNDARDWLDDLSLFLALHDASGGQEWSRWEPGLAKRDPAALGKARQQHAARIDRHRFVQWRFARQWQRLRERANSHGIKLVGDIPIFVAYHSADVWANPHLFHLGADGRPTVVAGVPPDYFSKTGQRWGNPLYRWDRRDELFRWWIARFRSVLAQVDVVRVDHFRGFAAYWEIPASEPTAINGRWVDGPGAALFDAVRAELGDVPVIAEDLGLITPDVLALRDRCGFPGMRILQFAFSGPDNLYLPHHFVRNTVVYTGTHDNDTTRGWYASGTEQEKDFARRYLGTDGREIEWDLIRLACQSVADLAIFPFQDLLGLGTEGRMNTPGLPAGNWDWRYGWEDVPASARARLEELTRTTHRLPSQQQKDAS